LTANFVGTSKLFVPIFLHPKLNFMTKDLISEFVDNNLYLNINQRIKLTLSNGDFLIGFFKKIPESEAESVIKLNIENSWNFFVIDPENNLPQEATVVVGDDIKSLEKIEL